MGCYAAVFRGRLVGVIVTIVALAAGMFSVGRVDAAAQDSLEQRPAEPGARGLADHRATSRTNIGVAAVRAGGARLAPRPGRPQGARIAEGTVLGVHKRSGRWLEVTTVCDATAWVHQDDVVVTSKAPRIKPGPGFSLALGVVAIDAGHGGERDPGAVGPRGLVESGVNLDVAERVRDLLVTSHDIDWRTGELTEGDEVPSVKHVVMTRASDRYLSGDYEAGLEYRSALANDAGAHAFISIHNNGGPTVPLWRPGTEVYYAVATRGSDRLGSLIHKELVRSFLKFKAHWAGGTVAGAQARTSARTGRDYYGVLRRARTPAVLVEGVYLTTPSGERLLKSERFRDAYAAGIYRGIIRFLTTDETGTRIHPPVNFSGGTVANHAGCVNPRQRDVRVGVRVARRLLAVDSSAVPSRAAVRLFLSAMS